MPDALFTPHLYSRRRSHTFVVKPRHRHMKMFAISLLALSLHFAVRAQGTLEFQNVNAAAGVNAPIYQADGVTKLSGSQFTAELLVGLSASSLSSIATTGFLTGNGAGYFMAPVQTVPNTSPGVSAFVQVDVWNTASGASFSQAKAS